MLSDQTREQVRKLAAQKRSERWIARHLGIARSTVRSILSNPDPPDRPPKPRIIDPYKDRIRELLEAEFTETLIFEELKAAGYPGGRTAVGDFVRTIRPEAKNQAYCRYETDPGMRSQIDWSEYQVSIANRIRTIHLFSMILCWSRYQYLEAFWDEKQSTLLYAHVAAWRFFEGLAVLHVYDRMASVAGPTVGTKILLNERFDRFAKHYDFKVKIVKKPHRKGKVERPFAYWEGNFLRRWKKKGFASLQHMNQEIGKWLMDEKRKTGNYRVHQTTHERPYDRWLVEKTFLNPLPENEFFPGRIEERAVAKDCSISVLGNRYTVPPRFVGRRVSVWINPVEVRVHDRTGEMVARHRLAEGKGHLIVDPQHYASIRRCTADYSRTAHERRFLASFPEGEAFLEALKARVRHLFPVHVNAIVSQLSGFTRSQVSEALQKALADGEPTATYVATVLAHRWSDQASGRHRSPLTIGPVAPGDGSTFRRIFDDDEDFGAIPAKLPEGPDGPGSQCAQACAGETA
jgi:transposase